MLKKKNVNLSNPNYRIITKEEPMSIAAEAYRRIKVDLLFAETGKEINVIQVCSSTKGEGKSTTVLNMAETYAEDDKKVLVVDLDLRSPKLHRSFKIKNKNGITDVLAGIVKLNDSIKYSDDYKFYLLNSGSTTIYPTAMLGSKKIEDLFQKLKEQFDVIIVDCPPILAVTDAAIISRLCDGCLFVVSQDKTDKSVAKEAVKILRKNNVSLLGAIYTEMNIENSAYNSKYKYYQKYSYFQKDIK